MLERLLLERLPRRISLPSIQVTFRGRFKCHRLLTDRIVPGAIKGDIVAEF